jgi:hypothetical protein
MHSSIKSEFWRSLFFKFTLLQREVSDEIIFQLQNLKINRAGNIYIYPWNPPGSEKQCIQNVFLWLTLFCVNELETEEDLKIKMGSQKYKVIWWNQIPSYFVCQYLWGMDPPLKRFRIGETSHRQKEARSSFHLWFF